MALVLADRVKETSTTTGTGTVTLSGTAPAGFQTFGTSIGNGNTTYYTIAGQGTAEWEVGIGTYSSTGPTLSRDTVLSSSAGGTTKVSFSAGIKDVFVTYPANKSIYQDASGNVGIGAASSGSLLEIRKDQNADTIAKVINSNTGVNATARLDLATGTANAYCIFALKDNGGSPYILMSSGSAITAMYHDMASHIFRSQAGTEWLRIEATAGTLLSAPTYNNTATGSTVVVTSTGQIRRTSSSIKYKKDVESLDPALATNAIDNLRPVWYRTKNAEGDDKVTWSHIGLIAEEVDLVEPRLVRYRTAEIVEEQKPVLDEAGAPVLNDEGNPTFTTEQVARELAVPEPEDVDYARLSVLLLAEVKALRERVAALEAA